MKDLKIVVIGFLSLTYAFSQSISGEVTDVDGKPLDGANIKVKGTDIRSSAVSNGSYKIRCRTIFCICIEFRYKTIRPIMC